MLAAKQLTILLLVISTLISMSVECSNLESEDFKDLESDISDEELDDMELDGTAGCTSSWYVDHLKLTLQWGPGACATGLPCVFHPDPEFTIHGLWPQKEGNSYPAFCCHDNNRFDVNEINRNLYNEMKFYWPSFTTSRSDVFWQHEWQKHGTCAKKVGLLSVNSYFNFAIRKFRQLDFTKLFLQHYIKPSNTVAYKGARIVDVLSDKHGREVSINCKQTDGLPKLTEVHVCFDGSTLEPTDCPPSSIFCLGDILVAAR